MRPGLLRPRAADGASAAAAARGRSGRCAAAASRPARGWIPPADGAALLWRSPAFAASGSRARRRRAARGVPRANTAGTCSRRRAPATIRRGRVRAPGRAQSAARRRRVAPVPASTRVGNWIAAALTPSSNPRPELSRGLWRALRCSRANVEDDVLGNHVIRNARALVLGGAALRDADCSRRGVELLGASSPSRCSPTAATTSAAPSTTSSSCATCSSRGVQPGSGSRTRSSGCAASRPGSPGRTARRRSSTTATLDLAPRLDLPAAAGRARRVRRTRATSFCARGTSGSRSTAARRRRRSCRRTRMRTRCRSSSGSTAGPSSSIPGTSTYEPGTERDWFRGTRAHSTVAVDGDQFELWGAFRRAAAAVELLEAAPTERLAASR